MYNQSMSDDNVQVSTGSMVLKMVENVKFRQIIAKNEFPRIFQQNEKFFEKRTSGCRGYAFVGVTSKSTNLAKITLLVSMETWSHDNSNKN